MWPVSDRFLNSLGRGPRYVSTCTVTPYGADRLDVQIVGGTLQVDGSSRIRRRVDSFEIVGDSAVYELVTAPGALFELHAGQSFRGSTPPELVPIFTGEAQTPRQRWGGGTISLTLLDNANWLSRCRFVSPYMVAAGTSRVSAITTVVQFARPGTEVIDESGDTSTVASQMVWSETALDVVADLATDAGLEGFFRPDGTFLIRRARTMSTPPVWSIRAGRGGTLRSLDRLRPTDRFYNTVVAQPSAQDGSQTWTDQVAQITDAADPLHPNRVGVVPYFLPLPTAATAAAAMSAANIQLDKFRGRTESLLFGTIANPALEAGDVIRLTSSRVNNDQGRSWQHFVDSFTYDLVAQNPQAGQTRAQVF